MILKSLNNCFNIKSLIENGLFLLNIIFILFFEILNSLISFSKTSFDFFIPNKLGSIKNIISSEIFKISFFKLFSKQLLFSKIIKLYLFLFFKISSWLEILSKVFILFKLFIELKIVFTSLFKSYINIFLIFINFVKIAIKILFPTPLLPSININLLLMFLFFNFYVFL